MCLLYQTLTSTSWSWSWWKSNQHNRWPEVTEPALPGDDAGRLVSMLEALRRDRELLQRSGVLKAVVLKGQRVTADTEVQLYLRVLEEMGHRVSLARYAERGTLLKTNMGTGEWVLLACLRSSEKSCLRRVPFGRLEPHQMVNMVPELVEAFSDAGEGQCQFYNDPRLAGFALPMMTFACRSTKEKTVDPPNSSRHHRFADGPSSAKPPAAFSGFFAAVNVYVLVTSTSPLTAFLHKNTVANTTNQLSVQTTQLRTFLLKHLGPAASHEALGHMKEIIGRLLKAAVGTMEETKSPKRCLMCYQLLTFTLHFTGSLLPIVVKIDTDLSFSGLSDPAFEGQIARELILEDTLRFLLPVQRRQDHTAQDGSCEGTHNLCLPENQLLLLLQFQRQLRTPGPFELLYPSAASEGWPHPQQRLLSENSSFADDTRGGTHLQTLLLRLCLYYKLHRNHTYRTDSSDQWPGQDSDGGHSSRERCVDPRLRQLYTDPPLTLVPHFSPLVKEYRTEVPFETLAVRFRPEPIHPACHVKIYYPSGPSVPIGLGNSQITILVWDEDMPDHDPVRYTLHFYRESRPSLPMFGDHVMCSIVQDCGLIVVPGQPCGLEPFPPETPGEPWAPPAHCTSGDTPGRWMVPCLSCSDNRTCDWRDVSWQPDGCYHSVVDQPRLQDCMAERKIVFYGDSTNRGMMYFLMERVNSTLEHWLRSHDMLFYDGLNRGRTHVSFSYYPQFWLEESARPTFQRSLEEILRRSQPLENSHRTALVVGGVHWLKASHLRVIQEILEREGLGNIMVVIKSLGLGFHLSIDDTSLSLRQIRDIYRENNNIMAAAKSHGYEVLDTFRVTMARFKEFLGGHCCCHFHEVDKLGSSTGPPSGRIKSDFQHSVDGATDRSTATRTSGGKNETGSGPGGPGALADSLEGSNTVFYHVRGPVAQAYSEILLSRLCPLEET